MSVLKSASFSKHISMTLFYGFVNCVLFVLLNLDFVEIFLCEGDFFIVF